MPSGPVVLVGHSMGGMTIMGLAALRPELFGTKVAAVALLSTSSGNLAELTFGLPELLTRVRAAFFPVAAWTMRWRPALAERTRRLAGDLVSAVTRSLSFASSDVDPALTRYLDAMIAGTPVDVIAEFYPALAGRDETGSLEPLRRVPTLVLTGDADKMIPKAHSELIVERLPDAEYVVVPDAGHMVLLEKPDEVSAALSALLRRVAAEAAGRSRQVTGSEPSAVRRRRPPMNPIAAAPPSAVRVWYAETAGSSELPGAPPGAGGRLARGHLGQRGPLEDRRAQVGVRHRLPAPGGRPAVRCPRRGRGRRAAAPPAGAAPAGRPGSGTTPRGRGASGGAAGRRPPGSDRGR